tara:strand:+ start:132 stop:362 length:231 start_codon:yes stop_codon:yes gene_type:complete
MTDEEILASAEATGLKLITLGLDKQKSEFLILAFAKQIAKLERHHEREACAQIADKHTKASFMGAVGAAIRARGEA